MHATYVCLGIDQKKVKFCKIADMNIVFQQNQRVEFQKDPIRSKRR